MYSKHIDLERRLPAKPKSIEGQVCVLRFTGKDGKLSLISQNEEPLARKQPLLSQVELLRISSQVNG